MSNLFTLLFIFILLSACQTTTSTWPKNIPPNQLFIDDYLKLNSKKKPGQRQIEKHLAWIKRFYQGSVLSIGWNEMTDTLLMSIDNPIDRQKAQQDMYDLGLKICLEWARNNTIRRINTKNIIVWGNSLKRSIDLNEQISLIEKVKRDVDDLLNNRLKNSVINEQRYYPPIDYNDF